MYITLEFNEQGISQMFTAIGADGKPYDYYILRRESRETFQTLTGPITELAIRYHAVDETNGITGPALTLAGAQALVNTRAAAASIIDNVARPFSVEKNRGQ